MRVWRFGLYYFFVFGGFVALAQWLVPYYVNAYSTSVALAGALAACNKPSIRSDSGRRGLDVRQMGRSRGDVLGPGVFAGLLRPIDRAADGYPRTWQWSYG